MQIRDRGLRLEELRRRARHPHEAPTALLPPRPDGEVVIGRRCAVHLTNTRFLIILSSRSTLGVDVLCRAGAAATATELRERLIEKLRLVLASGSDEECSVCLDSVRLPVITHCAHVYCRPCITQVISTEQVLPSSPLW